MLKGRVIYVGGNGDKVRVGAKSPDGLTWWWTQGVPGPKKGQTVPIPKGAKPEPGRRACDPEARRMVRAVALKAAALVLSGTSPEPEAIISLAEKLEAWLWK